MHWWNHRVESNPLPPYTDAELGFRAASERIRLLVSGDDYLLVFQGLLMQCARQNEQILQLLEAHTGLTRAAEPVASTGSSAQ
jgi:hypothetical protein